MSIKSYCYFAIGFIGDGSTTTKTANLLTAPFVLGGATAAGAGPAIASPFAISLGDLPSAVESLTSGVSCTVALGVITFTFDTAPADGALVTVYGLLKF